MSAMTSSLAIQPRTLVKFLMTGRSLRPTSALALEDGGHGAGYLWNVNFPLHSIASANCITKFVASGAGLDRYNSSHPKLTHEGDWGTTSHYRTCLYTFLHLVRIIYDARFDNKEHIYVSPFNDRSQSTTLEYLILVCLSDL